MNKIQRAYLLLGFRIASDFGVAIAAPVFAFVLVGRWLDKTYQFGMRYTIVAFILAAFASGTMVYQKAKKYANEYSGLIHQNTSTQDKNV